ncbi:MAG: hypothetical protein KatS3mg022_1717 [Armatimonadota bacterium]|nr:MAG: hypothetical protein KatS3mg022_1717 [Armatimonadota bacterium]
MGSATCRGLLKAKAVQPEQIIATDIHHEKVEALVRELGIRSASSNVEAAKQADIVMLCVKPYLIHDVVEEISGVITPDKLIISIAAGIPIARIEDLLPPRHPGYPCHAQYLRHRGSRCCRVLARPLRY